MKITVVEPDKTPPIIRLIEPKKDKFEVNEKITIRAKVTDDISVKDVHVHFSKKVRVLSELTEKDLDIYTTDIAAPEPGYIWYYVTATDEAGNESRYPQTEELKITVVEPDKTPPIIRLIEPKKDKFEVNEKNYHQSRGNR